MKLPIAAACFIDANIIFYIHDVKHYHFPDVIEKVYHKVMIHEEVMKELDSSGQAFVKSKIQTGRWVLFDGSGLTMTEQRMYLNNITVIDKKLKDIDSRRGKEGRKCWNRGNLLISCS